MQAPNQGLTSPWPPGSDAATAIVPLLAALAAQTTITIKGYASFEMGGPQALAYNTALARRRAIGLEAIIKDHDGGKGFATDPSADMAPGIPSIRAIPSATSSGKPSPPGRRMTCRARRRMARCRVGRGEPDTPVAVPDNPTAATPPPPPGWFKQLGARCASSQPVRGVRGVGEVRHPDAGREPVATGWGVGRGHAHAAASLPGEQSGRRHHRRAPGHPDRRRHRHGDGERLLRRRPRGSRRPHAGRALPNEPLAVRNVGRNYLGMAITFMPLLSAASDAVAGDGALTEIAVTGPYWRSRSPWRAWTGSPWSG